MNRTVTTHSIFSESSIDAIRPTGWMALWLQTQKSGLTGSLEVAGFPFDSKLWACDAIPHQSGAPWWPYEQTAYWVDGLLRCGILLEDEDLSKRGQAQCRYVLDNADVHGYLGPVSCKAPMVAGRWSHSIFFRALMAYAQTGHEMEVAAALEKHFLGHAHDHSGHRDVCCIEPICWTYSKTGNPALLDLAEKTWLQFLSLAEGDDVALTEADLSLEQPADCHGVTFCETLKLPAILYQVTGKTLYLTHARKGFDKLDRYHMLVTGAPSSTESLRGLTSLDAHETCDIADYTWAAGYMLMVSGEAGFADKIERACFNALPGAVTKDFRALQYFSCPNQVVLMENSTHTLAAAGGKFMTYRPRPGTECCTGQVHRPMPNYVARQWMWRDGNPAAVLYGPSRFSFQKDRTQVVINQSTHYPFDEEITFHIECTNPCVFSLWLRIPAWCENALISVNDETHPAHTAPGTFIELRRAWSDGDTVRLTLPMTVRLQTWPNEGISLERGPLVYSLAVEDTRRPDPDDPFQNADFPAWGMLPASPWNFGLELDSGSLADHVQVIRKSIPENPWLNPTVRLRVPAKRIPGWKLNEATSIDSIGGELIDPERNRWRLFPKIVHGDFLLTPALPDHTLRQAARQGEQEWIELVPIGATCLRITTFPQL